LGEETGKGERGGSPLFLSFSIASRIINPKNAGEECSLGVFKEKRN